MLKRYRCHKVVEAGRIESVRQSEFPADGRPVWIVGIEGESLTRFLEGKHAPEVGGYFVRYEDGYTSYSPAAAFESGYTLEERPRRAVVDLPVDAVELLARVCYAANREYALGIGEDPASLHAEWAAAPAEIRESVRVGVRASLRGASIEQLHESWLETKRADGWIYGLTRDNRSKVHPCMVPYDQLPIAQRRKDALFQAIVAALVG